MRHIDEDLHKALLKNGFSFVGSVCRDEEGIETRYTYKNLAIFLYVYTDERVEFPHIETEYI